MDWGLFRFGKHGGGAYGHPFLRPELVYPRTWVYYVAIVFDFFGRFIWMTRLIPMNLNVSVLSFILALIEMLRGRKANERWMWNFFRLENEHLNNCGQFRAIKDIPLPFHIRVEGESDEEETEEDQVSAADNNERQGTVKFSDGSQMGALAEGNKPDIKTKLGGATEDAANQLRFSSLTGSSHSVHTTVSSPGGIRPVIKSRPSDASIPPYDQQRSNTLMVDAMTEAGFADDRREQLVAANKFYGRRDFDSKIADGPVEGLFRIRRKSSASLSQIGLGINAQAVNTSQDGLSGSASRSRRNLKNAIFGRKHDTDEDYDSDTDEV
ncbi:hypothetical protein BGZ49_003154 [Haplosporangium sp. Z 27]|nr:hypothetical protein BGZ49_003154 [Haplosporangium sp. Z 27]